MQMSCINARQTQQIHPMDPVALGVMNQAEALAQQRYNFGAAMMQQQLCFQQQQAFLLQMASAQQAQQSSPAAATTSTANLGNSELSSNNTAVATALPHEQGLANPQQLAFNLYQQQYFSMMMAQQVQQQQFQKQTMEAAVAQQAQQIQQQQQAQAQRFEQEPQNAQWQPEQFQQTQGQQFEPQLQQGQESYAADIPLHVVSEQLTSNFADSNDFGGRANSDTMEPGDEESGYESAGLADDSVDLQNARLSSF